MLSALLLSLAAPEQPVTECQKDAAGECLTLAIRTEVAKLDAKQARAIYAPYFDCIYSALASHEDFGSRDPELANAVVTNSAESCAEDRNDADSQMDDFLETKSRYGDEANRLTVRNEFRQSFGRQWLAIRAARDDLGEQLVATLYAASQVRGQGE